MQEVDLRELRDAGEASVRRLVPGGDEPVLHGQPLRLLPDRRDLEFVDPVSPGVPLLQARLVQPVGELQPVQRATGDGTEFVEFRFELAQRVRGQRPPEP